MAGAGVEQPCQTLKPVFEKSLQSLSWRVGKSPKGLEKAEFCFKVLHIVKIDRRQRDCIFCGFFTIFATAQNEIENGIP